MFINKKYKLEKIANVKHEREYATAIKLTKNHAITTDGHVLAIVPIERGDDDTATSLSPELLKKGRPLMPKKTDQIAISHLNGTATLFDGSIHGNAIDIPFPSLKTVFPTEKPQMTICFNAKKLLQLVEALGAEEIVLDIYNAEKYMYLRDGNDTAEQFRIRVPDDKDAYGLLMGCRHRKDGKL